MGRKSHGEDYSDAELDFIASVAHSVQCGIDYAFGLPELHQWGLMGDGYKAQMKASVRAVLVHDKSPKSLHGSWLSRLTQEGWVHGEVKDAEKKTHPLLVPFDELPIEWKLRLRQFRAAVIPFRKTKNTVRSNLITFSTKYPH